MYKTIGIIGFGNMGSAIAEQLKGDYQIYVFDKDANKTKSASGIKNCESIMALVSKVNCLILAVKPQDFENALQEIRPGLSADKLIISIAAGITTSYIEKTLGIVRVIRAMPNIAAKIGEGISCLSKGRFAALEDLDFAQDLFEFTGEALVIEEKMMDAATAVSGSGPGFCFELSKTKDIDEKDKKAFKNFVTNYFVPALKSAAESVGFSEEEAAFLSTRTGNSCIGLAFKTKLTAEELIKQIASKGGTTEAGLEVLRKGGSLEDAVKAAKKMSEELSRKE